MTEPPLSRAQRVMPPTGAAGRLPPGGAVTVGPSVAAGFLILDGALMILRQPV